MTARAFGFLRRAGGPFAGSLAAHGAIALGLWGGAFWAIRPQSPDAGRTGEAWTIVRIVPGEIVTPEPVEEPLPFPDDPAPTREKLPDAEAVPFDAPLPMSGLADAPPDTRGERRERLRPRLEAAVSVQGDAQALSNPKPEYPPVAIRRGYEGTVVLEVEVLPDGAVGDVRVKSSSGHAILDRAAVDAVRLWRYEPARSLGRSRRSLVEEPVRFRLVDRRSRDG